MQPRVSVLLEDILEAAQFILDDTAGESFDSYRNNRRLRQLVERNFITIGEAIGQLSRLDQSTADRITDRGPIIAFRNQLIHVYRRIDQTEVWRIIQDALPRLKEEVEGLLREAGE